MAEVDLDIGAGGGGVLASAYGPSHPAHASLHMVVPVLPALQAAVDLKQKLVAIEADVGDLDLIAFAGRGAAVLLGHHLPLGLIPGACLGVKLERFRGSRKVRFGFGVFGRQVAQDFDLFIVRQLVFDGDDAGASSGQQNDQAGAEGSKASSGSSSSHVHPRRRGTFHSARNSNAITMEVSGLASGPYLPPLQRSPEFHTTSYPVTLIVRPLSSTPRNGNVKFHPKCKPIGSQRSCERRTA